ITAFIVGFVLDLINLMILDRIFADKGWKTVKQDKSQEENLTDSEDTRSDHDSQNETNKEMINYDEDEGIITLSEEEFEEINRAITIAKA
ncbi:17336_t:CDS:1, partial [Dentiscutata heterogama]